MSISRLLQGFSTFRSHYFDKEQSLYQTLVNEGQKPSVCVVACADSRVDPAIVLQTQPGDIFSIRNVANLVPPYETAGTYHGTSAALEFAVTGLHVEHIVVFGHAHCGGVQALRRSIEQPDTPPPAHSFVHAWMSVLKEACKTKLGDAAFKDEATRQRACEHLGVKVSLENLMTFPFVKERVEAGTLQLHGWYIDILEGRLLTLDPKTGDFIEQK